MYVVCGIIIVFLQWTAALVTTLLLSNSGIIIILVGNVSFFLLYYCMYWLVSYRWIYTLFSSKLLLSLWLLVSATILGVAIVTLGTTLVMSGARMLMYGPACPCMCLQASVHSCSAGLFFLITSCNLRWNSFSQSSFKSILSTSIM